MLISNKRQKSDAVVLTWMRSFITGTAPCFNSKWCANPASTWALFIKHSSLKWREHTNALATLCYCPGKTNCIHCSCNAGFFGKLNTVIFPSHPKTHLFGDILEQIQCSAADDFPMKRVDVRDLALLWSTCAWARFSKRNAHIRSSTTVYVIKSTIEKKQPKLVPTQK